MEKSRARDLKPVEDFGGRIGTSIRNHGVVRILILKKLDVKKDGDADIKICPRDYRFGSSSVYSSGPVSVFLMNDFFGLRIRL